jgi:hypothetical protein
MKFLLGDDEFPTEDSRREHTTWNKPRGPKAVLGLIQDLFWQVQINLWRAYGAE